MDERLHLDALIAPARSLPVKGFVILIGLLLVVNILVGTMFVLMGAWPAPIFLGLDVAGVSLAFWLSYRQVRSGERVQVTADQVRVLHERGDASSTVWSSPTAFTRVALEETGRHGKQVRLRLSNRRHTIGLALGPRERAGLADQVEAAIRAARAERHEA
ncbi:MAG: DUF2244 domain-containing protein [Caulobacteraceae bacterium]